MITATPEAYRLMHEGALALSRAEAAGIRIDTKRLDNTIEEVQADIKGITEELRKDTIYKTWRRRFGEKTNINSRDQLAKVLFDTMGYERPDDITATGKTKVDALAIEKVNIPFTKAYLKLQKLEKLLSTYLLGVQRHVTPAGYLHPSYALHTVETFRGSCLEPNFQNIPIREGWIAKLIRSCFIARDGHQLLENDFKGAEVCVAACYHKDPTMLKYLATGYDMHKAMGGECYLLPEAEVPKAVRQQAKSLFVFAEFYGDWYPQVTKNLWEAIERYGLTTADGTPLKKHLRSKGIKALGDCIPEIEPKNGTFEKHIKEVEAAFWNKRFPVYKKWKYDWYEKYLKLGYFVTLTGFVCQGVYSRNQVVNYPVQGSSFHCLLWYLTRMTKKLIKYKMRSRIVGQIHDSALSDVHQAELDDFLNLAMETMDELHKAWPWIITRIGLEAELSPPGGSWYDKQELKLAA